MKIIIILDIYENLAWAEEAMASAVEGFRLGRDDYPYFGDIKTSKY